MTQGGFVSFSLLGLPPAIVKGLRAAGHVDPTPIQRKAIPIILQGNDLIAAAQSGTGKTGAYLLPILTRLLEGPRRLRVLVLTPTRELAARVETMARGYARFTDLRTAIAHSGMPLATNERALRQEDHELLVGQPSRLLELHARQAVNFEDVEMLVLDEADQMVDIGSAAELRKLLKLLPETRQTLVFSVTMPPELNRVAKEALVEPVRVDLAAPSAPTAGIKEAVYPVPRDLKTDLLKEILARNEMRNVIVFTRTQSDSERLGRSLERSGYSVASLHDTRSQAQRQRALEDLKRGRLQILLATDVASRSVDVDGISHVVNFDVPHAPEDYVHRIGGPERAGGDAYTLMSPDEQREVGEIERFLGRTVARVMLPDFDYKMRPTEIKQAVSYETSGGRPLPPAKGAARPAPAPSSARASEAAAKAKRTASKRPAPAVAKRRSPPVKARPAPRRARPGWGSRPSVRSQSRRRAASRAVGRRA